MRIRCAHKSSLQATSMHFVCTNGTRRSHHPLKGSRLLSMSRNPPPGRTRSSGLATDLINLAALWTSSSSCQVFTTVPRLTKNHLFPTRLSTLTRLRCLLTISKRSSTRLRATFWKLAGRASLSTAKVPRWGTRLCWIGKDSRILFNNRTLSQPTPMQRK